MTAQSPITVSLEMSRALKAAGYPQGFVKGFFYRGDTLMHKISQFEAIYTTGSCVGNMVDEEYAAPTCEELLRKLPDGTSVYKYGERNYFCANKISPINGGIEKMTFPTAADACAAVYIYLSNNKLLPDTL